MHFQKQEESFDFKKFVIGFAGIKENIGIMEALERHFNKQFVRYSRWQNTLHMPKTGTKFVIRIHQKQRKYFEGI